MTVSLPDVYRNYICDSFGEFSVAKDQNVRFRSGWFSDRSACYLSAGRPVIQQDTGFGNILRTGSGLFAVRNEDEALDAIERIASGYQKHSNGARAIAHEFFDSDHVLAKILRTIGLL